MKNLAYFAVTFVSLIILANNYQVNGLSCVTCTSCSDPYSASSDSSVNCTTGLDTCLKSRINYPGGSMTQKSCVASSACTEKSFSIAGYGFTINCCKTDNCNSSNNLRISLKSLSLFSVSILLMKCLFN